VIASHVEATQFKPYTRVVNLPGFTVTVKQELEALRDVAGQESVLAFSQPHFNNAQLTCRSLFFHFSFFPQGARPCQIQERPYQCSNRWFLASSVQQRLLPVSWVQAPRGWFQVGCRDLQGRRCCWKSVGYLRTLLSSCTLFFVSRSI
jgi:hypothetical protein